MSTERLPLFRQPLAHLAAVLLSACTLCAQAQTTVRMAVSSSLAPPFVNWRDNTPAGGFDIELGQLLAQSMGLKLELIVLPRARLELAAQAGDVDLLCHVNPHWVKDAAAMVWTAPLFDVHDVLLGHAQAQPVDRPEDLPTGATVGTVLGYVYPKLEEPFQSGRIKREDALNEERLMGKLARDRHPYGVLNQFTVGAARNEMDALALGSWRVLVGSSSYHCAVPLRARIDAAALVQALEGLRGKGLVNRILASWNLQSMAVVTSVRSKVRELDRQQIAELYLGRRTQTTQGTRLTPVMSQGMERGSFLSRIVQREPSEYRAIWASQSLGGRKRAPLELQDAAAVRNHLQQHADSIGFLPVQWVDASLRILYMP